MFFCKLKKIFNKNYKKFNNIKKEFIMKFLIVFLFLVMATSCSHKLTKKECSNKDLFKLGQDLASKGYKLSIFEDIQKSCKEHGINVEKISFKKGWYEGMRKFCTYKSGFHFGASNRNDPGICIGELKADFEKGYNNGRKSKRGRGKNKKGYQDSMNGNFLD